MSVDIDSGRAVPLTPARRSPLQRLTSLFVQLFERYTPDPYILAVGLTILTGLLAAVLAPKGSARLCQVLAVIGQFRDHLPFPRQPDCMPPKPRGQWVSLT